MVQYKATDVRSNARCLNVSTSLCILVSLSLLARPKGLTHCFSAYVLLLRVDLCLLGRSA